MSYETPYCITLEDGDLPSVRVIQSVAAIIDAGRGELTPLHSVIDPEALNSLIRTGEKNSVSFEYEGFHITAHGDNRVVFRNPESVHTKLDNASNILLLAPRKGDDELCTDLYFPYPPDQENILSVTIDQTADEKVNEWHAQGHDPAEHKIISLGEFTRSGVSTSVTFANSVEADLIVNDQDLSTLQTRISTSLDGWQSNSNVTAVCFHSIDGLLSQTDLDTVFSFLYDLTSKIADSDAIAHFHLDPLQCDDSVVNVLMPLFDAVVSEDGESTASLRN